MIHGGPTGWDSDAWDDNWTYPVNLMTQRGAFVLRPNYHGGANYGLKWFDSFHQLDHHVSRAVQSGERGRGGRGMD